MGSVNCVRFSIVALISCYNSKTCKKTKVNWKKLNRYECDVIGYLSPYVALWWSILMFSFLMYIEGNLTHHFSFTWISNNHHIHVYLLHLSNCQFYFIFFHLWFFFSQQLLPVCLCLKLTSGDKFVLSHGKNGATFFAQSTHTCYCGNTVSLKFLFLIKKREHLMTGLKCLILFWHHWLFISFAVCV